MRYRALGRTGLEVSEIGFGAWGIGGDAGGAVAYGPTDRAESLTALRAALDRGITFYDTADFYGHGRSEELIGEAFAGRRGEVVIASKAGLLPDGKHHDFSPGHLRRSLESSLRRLRTDYVDLYQLHGPPPGAFSDETLDALQSLQREGKARAIGLSARSPEEGRAAAGRFGFACLQINFNLLDQRAAERGLFDLAAREGTGIIVRTPLCFGFLTGRYTARDPFHERDHRGRWSADQRERWASAPERFAALISELPGQSPAQFALRYCLSYTCVSTAIPGMLTASHVEENAGASALPPLDEAERARIAGIYRQSSFFAGR
ncbi:MAG: aldo/keto reductase [Betaproteobacteria bacterium]|nr:aldo/keto reductase [Betaproteobacteria bacterium]